MRKFVFCARYCCIVIEILSVRDFIMALFRANEAAKNGYEYLENYLLPRSLGVDELERERSKQVLQAIVKEYGAVVESYPTWHPLVWNNSPESNKNKYITTPSEQCGYKGLDHIRHFANAFVTCPYGDGQSVIDSVNALPQNSIATITAKKLDVKLYNLDATPILVMCDWHKPLSTDGTIPLSIALPLILQKELPNLISAERTESWESMRPYLLGIPHGSRSSLFVNQETGQAIKKIWNALINTGVFGA